MISLNAIGPGRLDFQGPFPIVGFVTARLPESFIYAILDGPPAPLGGRVLYIGDSDELSNDRRGNPLPLDVLADCLKYAENPEQLQGALLPVPKEQREELKSSLLAGSNPLLNPVSPAALEAQLRERSAVPSSVEVKIRAGALETKRQNDLRKLEYDNRIARLPTQGERDLVQRDCDMMLITVAGDQLAHAIRVHWGHSKVFSRPLADLRDRWSANHEGDPVFIIDATVSRRFQPTAEFEKFDSDAGTLYATADFDPPAPLYLDEESLGYEGPHIMVLSYASCPREHWIFGRIPVAHLGWNSPTGIDAAFAP